MLRKAPVLLLERMACSLAEYAKLWGQTAGTVGLPKAVAARLMVPVLKALQWLERRTVDGILCPIYHR